MTLADPPPYLCADEKEEQSREYNPPMDGQEMPDGDWLAVGPLGVFVATLDYVGENDDDFEWRLTFLPNDQLDECVRLP